MKKEIVKKLTFVYWIPFSIVIILNVFNSLFRTTYFDLYQYVEIAKYKWDNPGILLGLTAVALIFICLVLNVDRNKVKIEKAAMIWIGAVSLGSVLLFRCIAKCDSGFLNEIAIQFLQNDFQAFEEGGYLYMYPFQLGFTAVMEWIYRVFGIENFIVFELINIVCVLNIMWMVQKITKELFEDEKTYKTAVILSAGMFPLFLLSTFIYGDIPGWCLAVNAIYRVVRYLKTDKWLEIIKASIWLSGGVILKSNLNIMLVAAVIAIVLHAFEGKKVKPLLGVVVMIIVSQLGMMIINGIYSVRIGDEIPKGIPKIAWVAMGMQEPYEDGSPAGWYNGYNWDVYTRSGYDSGVAKEACYADLKQSFQHFAERPKKSVLFFYEKFTAQWNDPSFMSLLTNEWYSRNVEPQSQVAEFFLYGAGRKLLLFIMNIYHFLIFLGAAIFCVGSISKWSLPKAYLMLNIFGGLLFHMIWEAKARYVLIYFVLMIPLAAWGYVKLEETIFCKMKKKIVSKD